MARKTRRKAETRRAMVADDRPIAGSVISTPTGTRHRLRVRDEAVDASLASINAILSEAATGRTNRLIDLCKSTRTRDSRLGAVCRTRILAVQSRPWTITAPEGYERDPNAVEVAHRVRRIFQETVGLQKVIGHLAHGSLEGFAAVELDWRVNGRGEIVGRPIIHHSNRFAWDTANIELCKFDSGIDTFPGTPLSTWPGKFVVHAPVAGESDYPWFRGAMRARVVASVIKRLGLRWWLKLLERWGQPQVWATIPDDARDNVGDDVMDALRSLGSAWFARFPAGVDVKSVDVAVDKDLHNTWVQFHATEDAIAILGQNLTTEVQAGSLAAAKVQAGVRADILAADLSELAETIVDQWISWLVHYNWPGSPVPKFDFVLAPKSEITVAEYQAGLFTADEARGSRGYDPKPNGTGEGYATPAAPPSGGADAGSPFTTPSATSSTSPTRTHPLARSLSLR